MRHVRSISLSFSFDFMQIEKNTAILSIHICINCNEMTKYATINHQRRGRRRSAGAGGAVWPGPAGLRQEEVGRGCRGGGRPGLGLQRGHVSAAMPGPSLRRRRGPAASLGRRGPRAAASPRAAGGRGGPGRHGSGARRAWVRRSAGVGPASVGCRCAERGRRPA